jgi:hypothetical protein
LFNNGPIPAGFNDSMDDEGSAVEGEISLDDLGVSKPKTGKKGKKEKESQYYRLKPPPKNMIQSSLE